MFSGLMSLQIMRSFEAFAIAAVPFARKLPTNISMYSIQMTSKFILPQKSSIGVCTYRNGAIISLRISIATCMYANMSTQVPPVVK
jgi:hypothetical protein